MMPMPPERCPHCHQTLPEDPLPAPEIEMLDRWLRTRVQYDPDRTTPRSALYASYLEFARTLAGPALSPRAFYPELNRRGHRPVKVQGIRSYRGLVV